jgi:hypothetical protein
MLSFADISAGTGKHRHCTNFCVILRLCQADKLKSPGIEDITGKDAGWHIPFRVDSLDSTPEIIFIHDVIMDKCKGVRELKRERRLDNILGTSPFYRISSEHDNCRAKAFAPGSEKVSTRFVQFTNLIDKIPVDHEVNFLCDRFKIR